jgi:glycosyltransferase involved in cell wall biosynthesis
VCLIAGGDRAAEIGPVPSNLTLYVDQPLERVREAIAAAQVVALPVKPNSYSGATTTLLQCMAMGKAVAVSKVGAIEQGYGFVGDEHLCWIEPENQDFFDGVVERLHHDPGLRSRLGAAAREYVASQLDWCHYVARMERLVSRYAAEPIPMDFIRAEISSTDDRR